MAGIGGARRYETRHADAGGGDETRRSVVDERDGPSFNRGSGYITAELADPCVARIEPWIAYGTLELGDNAATVATAYIYFEGLPPSGNYLCVASRGCARQALVVTVDCRGDSVSWGDVVGVKVESARSLRGLAGEVMLTFVGAYRIRVDEVQSEPTTIGYVGHEKHVAVA